MFDIDKIPNLYKQDDLLFHYTNNTIAIKHILHEKRLRLSPRKNSIDPVENEEIFFTLSETSLNANDESSEGAKVYEIYNTKINNAKQLCFCKNNIQSTEFPEYEDYGFLKPRMWDQYGDSYRGVCICFSLQRMCIPPDFLHVPVDYVKYSDLQRNHQRIDVNRLESIGFVPYCKEYEPEFNKIFFRKHIDYKTENEYRIVSFSDRNYDYINIEDSIVGIIVQCDFIADFDFKAFEKYSESLNCNLLLLSWDSTGISIMNGNN